MALLEGQFYILNEKARLDLPLRVGERCLLIDMKYRSSNFDYVVEFDDGETSPVREKELNELTVDDIAVMDYIFTENFVFYMPTHEEVLISKVDYLHKQAEIDFQNGASTVVGFESLRAKDVADSFLDEDADEDGMDKFTKIGLKIGKFTDMKNKQYGSSVDATYEMIKVLMERYKNDNGTYTIPESLLQHILLQVRMMDKINRIFNNPTGIDDSESPYKDLCGYSLIGIDMVDK